MRYQVYQPCDLLRPYIRSFAVSESAEAGRYTVLPDTGLVMGLQYKGRLSHEEVPGNRQLLSTAGITGLHDRHRIFASNGNTGSILVYFQPLGAAAFFRLPVHELFRMSLSLEDLFPRQQLRDLEERLAAEETDVRRIAHVEAFLCRNLCNPPGDGLVQAAVGRILQSHGLVSIGQMARDFHTSQSPLEKRFRRIVGTSPKKFAGIVQLRRVIDAHVPGQSLTGLAHQAGFYDQAHFIRAFRQFAGQTPAQYFGARGK
jgi:AraC-like DNA-binding protein